MKNIRQLTFAITSIGLAIALFSNGCSKDIPDSKLKNEISDFKNVDFSVFNKDLKLRFSPSLKVSVKTEHTKSPDKMPKDIDRMNSILKVDQIAKKSKSNIANTSSVTFTATSMGSYYTCYGEIDEPGPTAWWLINTYTWVMTPLGNTSDNYISFYVNTPDMLGSYRLWGENISSSSGTYTNYQDMGAPYSGVSMVSGVMSFTDTTAMHTIETRIANAMENHLTNFADPLDYMSDDDYNTYADNAGFDEFLPMREFEAHFGHYSLRQKIESEEIAWLNSSSDPWGSSPHPDDIYTIEDEYDRVFRNQYSQVKISGELYQPVSATKTGQSTINCLTQWGICTDNESNAGWQDLPDGRRIHCKVVMSRSQADANALNVIRPFVKGKIRCYKIKGSFFSKRRTKMEVRIRGTAYTTNIYSNPCGDVHHVFDETRPLKRSWHRDKEKTYRTNNIHVKTCETYATFTVSSNPAFNWYLN